MRERAVFFAGTLRPGGRRLDLDDPDDYLAWGQRQSERIGMGESGTRFVIRIEEQWSAEAKDFYFKIVKWISDYTGYTPHEVHDDMKRQFNDGESITGLGREQFKVYTDAVIHWAATKCDIVVPEADRYHREKQI